jgi:hypothetical protein
MGIARTRNMPPWTSKRAVSCTCSDSRVQDADMIAAEKPMGWTFDHSPMPAKRAGSYVYSGYWLEKVSCFGVGLLINFRGRANHPPSILSSLTGRTCLPEGSVKNLFDSLVSYRCFGSSFRDP